MIAELLILLLVQSAPIAHADEPAKTPHAPAPELPLLQRVEPAALGRESMAIKIDKKTARGPQTGIVGVRSHTRNTGRQPMMRRGATHPQLRRRS